jgi:hypothetical protein
LKFDKSPVGAVGDVHQLFMGPRLDNPAITDNTDSISRTDGAEAMGDHDQHALFAFGL